MEGEKGETKTRETAEDQDKGRKEREREREERGKGKVVKKSMKNDFNHIFHALEVAVVVVSSNGGTLAEGAKWIHLLFTLDNFFDVLAQG